MNLNFLWKLRGLPMTVMGSSSSHARRSQLGLDGPRVLADAEDDELGGLVRGEAHPSDELAGEDDGRGVQLVGDVDDEGLRWLSRAERPAGGS